MRSVSPASIGTSTDDFHLVNVGKHLCELTGFPKLREQLTHNRIIAIRSGHSSGVDGIHSPVVLRPGQHAAVLVTTKNGCRGGTGVQRLIFVDHSHSYAADIDLTHIHLHDALTGRYLLRTGCPLLVTPFGRLPASYEG